VARAIAASRLPVVSAIGHETDFTIADFVADLRAPTPSAAAELITEAQHKIAERVAEDSHRLDRAARFQLLQARQRLTRLPVSRAEGRVNTLLHRLAQRMDEFSFRQGSMMARILQQDQQRVAELNAAVLRHDPRQQLGHARERLANCRMRLDRTLERRTRESAARLSALDARLHSLSPLAVLDRGYALVIDARGGVVRATTQVKAGDKVTTRLSDGAFTSCVESAAATNAIKTKK
jgi:exodeoxyribonuclease VII large subunit